MVAELVTVTAKALASESGLARETASDGDLELARDSALESVSERL
jgi:hypothetical protein